MEIRSGFKNLSNIKLNLIGSTSVIDKHHATKDPAPDPLPGPTGIFVIFCPFNVVRYNQKITRIFHFNYNR